MSLNAKKQLSQIAVIVCRELRRKSTPAEKIMWEYFRNRKFNNLKFYRQHPLFYDITGKESFFIADFYCHEKSLVIEIDGFYHKYKLSSDQERTSIINQLGIRVIRFSNEEVVGDPENVLWKLKHVCEVK